MHFLLGWPSTLKLPLLPPLQLQQVSTNGDTVPADSASSSLSQSTAAASTRSETIHHFAQNRSRTRTAVVTDTAVYLFHFQQGECMCVGVWRRSPDSLHIEGTNGSALFSADDSMIAVTTTRNVLNVLRIREIHTKSSSASNGAASTNGAQQNNSHSRNNSGTMPAEICSFAGADWHSETTLNAPIFHPLHLQLQSRVKLANDYITCACDFGNEMVLGTRGGYIQVVGWDGVAKTCVDALAWTTSASRHITVATPSSATPYAGMQTPATPALPSALKPAVAQIATSSTLGVAFVLKNGCAGLCTTGLLSQTTANASLPPIGAGMLLVHGTRADDYATRVALNDRYRLLAIGLENGDVVVFRIVLSSIGTDANSPSSSSPSSSSSPIHTATPLRRYSITPWGFTSHDVGSVRCMSWSPDGSVLAVGWSRRGLVVWSTGGTRVACTLPMLSTPLPLSITTPQQSPRTVSSTATSTPHMPPRTTSSASLNGISHPLHPQPPLHTRQPSYADSFSITAAAAATALPPTAASTNSFTPSPAAPSFSTAPASELLGTGVQCVEWGCAGSSLLVSGNCSDITHSGFIDPKLKGAWSDQVNPNGTHDPLRTLSPNSPSNSHCGCGLVTRLSLVRSALMSNPSQNSITSMSLLGDDRVVMWTGKRGVKGGADEEEEAWISEETHQNDTDVTNRSSSESSEERARRDRKRDRKRHTTDRFLESDGDWEHVTLPSVYLNHAWPIRYCAMSTSGNQVACAGTRGFICHTRISNVNAALGGTPATASSTATGIGKWRRFGNLLHESQVHAAALAWYGEHVVCVASRGSQSAHQIAGRTSASRPPPPVSKHAQSISNENPSDDTIELLFFPRTHLDNSSLLHTHVLTHASTFHALDIVDHTMMVYLSVGQVMIYRLKAEVHPAPGRGQTVTQQSALLSKLGVMRAQGGPIPYSTTANAHDGLGTEHELRMTIELAHVIDLCAPLVPIRMRNDDAAATSSTPDLSSLQSMLSTPPLQARLWLTSADQIGDDLDGVTYTPQRTHSMSSATADEASSQQMIYTLPLFTPNSISSTLEALHHATVNKGKTSASAQQEQTNAMRGLSFLLLTSTGTLLAIDIASSLASFVAPLISPSSSAPPLTPPTPSSIPVMRAWCRIVAHDVDQFWLHDMSTSDTTQEALQYLMPKKMRSLGPSASYESFESIKQTLHASTNGTPTSSSALEVFHSVSSNKSRGQRLFSYGSRGFDVWFRMPSPITTISSLPPQFTYTKLLDFDAEVYPLGMDERIGVIVGITKGLRTKSMMISTPATTNLVSPTSNGTFSSSSNSSSPFWEPIVCFRLQTKLQPYLHGILMHLVANDVAADLGMNSSESNSNESADDSEFAYAYEIAESCRRHSYFPISLELLLHTALNPPSSSSSSSLLTDRASRATQRDRALGRVISFLRLFPEFPDIVMNCARKNDSEVWPRLFSRAGSPEELFQLCLKHGKLRMASCYLIVIQRTKGMIVAREHAAQVLRRIEIEERVGSQRSIRTSHQASPTATPPLRPASTSADQSSLIPPIGSPQLTSSISNSASPGVPTFRRRRRLSALERELQRFIALTHGMEEEMMAQRALAIAEEAARTEAERRRKEADQIAQSRRAGWLPRAGSLTHATSAAIPVNAHTNNIAQIDAAAWSNPSVTTPHGTTRRAIIGQQHPPPQQQHQQPPSMQQQPATDGINETDAATVEEEEEGGCQIM